MDPVYEDRNLEVIGAGLGRTGTSSLKAALEILGYRDTYHMTEVFKNDDQHFWCRVFDKKKYDFNEVFKHNGYNYTASCDFPSAIVWREQLAQFPEAKVILSVRDPEKWYQSCCDTIFTVIPTHPYRKWGCWFRRLFNTLGSNEMHIKMCKNFCNLDWRKEHVIQCFKDHNEAVIAECPKEKLLVFEVSQGWEPLCRFLCKPIPDCPFPNVNDTAQFKARVEALNNEGIALFRNWVVPGLMLGAALLRQYVK